MGVCSSKSPESPEATRTITGAKTSSTASASSWATGESVLGDFCQARAISNIDNQGKIRDWYSIEKGNLSVSSTNTVSKGRKRSSKEPCAVKTISKAKVKNFKQIKQIEREIGIMKELDHKNIIKLIECFEDARTIRLVMELCSGGQLDDRLVEVKKFTESQAAYLMHQIFEAVFYLHAKQVCHRDLKPDNILFTKRDVIECSVLKVIDFGSACFFSEGQYMHTKAGSSYYVAPQVLGGKYDKASDLWSCGVIMHLLLCGYPPFIGETEDEVLIKVRKGSFEFTKKDWKKVSDDAQALIRMLIKMNPHDRFTAEQALKDTWILNKAPKASPDALDNASKLRRHCSGRKLKKASLHSIAEQLSEGQIRRLDDVFFGLDSDHDGMLDVAQLRHGLKYVGLKEVPADFDLILEEVESDPAGSSSFPRVVDYHQFVKITLEKKQVMQETACWTAFNDADGDGDGKINKMEIEDVLGSTSVREVMGSQSVAAALQKVQPLAATDVVSFEEFMSAFSGSTSKL